MIRHSGKHGAGQIQRWPDPVQGDAEREIRNGYPSSVYLPRDPGRRARLLQALEGRNSTEGSVTEDNDYMREGTDA